MPENGASNGAVTEYAGRDTVKMRKARFKPVELEGYDKPFLIRRMSAGDRLKYAEQIRANDERDFRKLTELRNWSVARCWINKDGTRVLDADLPNDIAVLEDMDYEDVEELFAHCVNLGAVDETPTPEAAAEDLGNAPSASSPTESRRVPIGE